MSSQARGWAATIADLFAQNVITLFGAVLTTISALLLIVFVVLGALGVFQAAYIGILTFVLLPTFFVTGLLIIPIGVVWQRYRAKKPTEGGEALSVWVLDLRSPKTRKAFALIAFLTVINISILSTVTYKGYHYTESVAFCGTLCHTVMEPEHTAYLGSPHSKVRCTECHIGSGAPWFVRAKISGMGQVLAVLFDTYERPIPTPVRNLRPSRDTCEECHWPDIMHGDRLKVITRFADDEANTRQETVLLLHIGGGKEERSGIHSWHISPAKKTLYLPADESRQKISLVRVISNDGKTLNYSAEDFTQNPDEIPDSKMRVMDCIDCHNRPTHIFSMPTDAVDAAMAAGRIDASLPSVKKVGVETLKAAATVEEPSRYIEQKITEFYQQTYPAVLTEKGDALKKAVSELDEIYRRNVFPAMKVGWGNYPTNLSHTDFPGCFRCHDEGHKNAEGDTITQDCTSCHSVLAMGEEKPEILTTLGIEE